MSTDDLQNETVNPAREALRNAFANAIVAVSRERATELCVAAGASEGPHAWRRVPANKVAAVTAELEKLVAASPSARQPERRSRSAIGRGASKSKPKTFAEAFDAKKVEDVFLAWNSPKALNTDDGDEDAEYFDM